MGADSDVLPLPGGSTVPWISEVSSSSVQMLRGSPCAPLFIPPVIILPVHLLAISLAVFRHGHRYRTKQYYWDDLFAASTLTSDVGLFLSVWVWPLDLGTRVF